MRFEKGIYYYEELLKFLEFLIPPYASVIHIGCGSGEIIGYLRASYKAGVDANAQIIEKAKERFHDVEFIVGNIENVQVAKTFDYVLVINAIEYVNDIQRCFENIKPLCRPDTRIIIIYFNYLWEPVLKFAEKLGLRRKRDLMEHYLSAEDLEGLLSLCDFEPIKRFDRFLLPVHVPMLSYILNKLVVKIPFMNNLALNYIIIARLPMARKTAKEVSCSIVIPCRNEKGNIEEIVKRVPRLGKATELLFIEGHSKDGTLEECLRVQREYNTLDIKVSVQDGIGKGDAVLKGFRQATGDVLMILDADITVPPEDLGKFFETIVSGKGELVMGNRLMYQMESQAMRHLNLAGNKFFSAMFTFLLCQRIKDTLCGTKVLWKEDHLKILAGKDYFGDIDPFGDFDLILGAAKLNMKIVEIPIRYRERVYGTTQISRFRHGLLLLRMVIAAFMKLKWV
ncbi:glycosyltransferase [Candidatus Magnetobacterium casense]|uniref:Glycosyltransferase n=1 Tax=Candidatus Magnetobacterium casense TaxID=1455061 RepID=A0ABS6RUM2_9BACT|nr:glycosyltransferase [Candidatus Magnetobacterium casensis]MBV6340319.1 glycosyltransferase [Candidatus Magnetobacterium casensis]